MSPRRKSKAEPANPSAGAAPRRPRWFVAAVAVLTLLAVAFFLWQGRGVRRDPSLSVVLITIDTLRADALGAYGAGVGVERRGCGERGRERQKRRAAAGSRGADSRAGGRQASVQRRTRQPVTNEPLLVPTQQLPLERRRREVVPELHALQRSAERPGESARAGGGERFGVESVGSARHQRSPVCP